MSFWMWAPGCAIKIVLVAVNLFIHSSKIWYQLNSFLKNLPDTERQNSFSENNTVLENLIFPFFLLDWMSIKNGQPVLEKGIGLLWVWHLHSVMLLWYKSQGPRGTTFVCTCAPSAVLVFAYTFCDFSC